MDKRALIMGNGPSLNKLIEYGLDKIPEDIDTEYSYREPELLYG